MKYLILLGVVFGVIWWIKLNRASSSQDRASGTNAKPLNMVQCAHCGLHLPENEAIQSRQAVYCSDAHRALAEH